MSDSFHIHPILKKTKSDHTIFSPCPVPIEPDGFIQTFSYQDIQTNESPFLDFFMKHGVVAIRDVLSHDECQRTIEESWRFMQSQFNAGIDPNIPSTWEQDWPQYSKQHNRYVGKWLSKQATLNRQHPAIHSIFSVLFRTPRLIVNIAPPTIVRPTKHIKWSVSHTDQKTIFVDRPQWKDYLHWIKLDINPLTGRAQAEGFDTMGHSPFDNCMELNPSELSHNNANRMLKLFGTVALTECPESSGGFHCIPGFHRYIKTWTSQNEMHCEQSNMGSDPYMVKFRPEDPLRQYIQRLPLRQGTLLIWDGRIPNGSFPNTSDRLRICQNIRMAPCLDEMYCPLPLIEDDFPQDVNLSKLGLRLYGLERWSNPPMKTKFFCCIQEGPIRDKQGYELI